MSGNRYQPPCDRVGRKSVNDFWDDALGRFKVYAESEEGVQLPVLVHDDSPPLFNVSDETPEEGNVRHWH